MSAASDLTAARIVALNEEGFRADVYDDATGKPIACTGEPTVGYGTRCRQWSTRFAGVVLDWQLAHEFEAPLLQHSWYLGCNDARRSALLEIAFNQGVQGLLGGYPKLIAAVSAEDWAAAAEECTVNDERLEPRYARLARILSTGVAT